jgi:hypothetical protein
MGWPLLRALANERTTLKTLISIRPRSSIYQQPRWKAMPSDRFNKGAENHARTIRVEKCA